MKHFDAYADVAWDDAGVPHRPTDPRWELPPTPVSARPSGTEGSRAEVRSRIGLHSIAANMKAGLQFESVLKRGLLEYAYRLPDRSPEFRYVYHEVIEEAQHSLMFQEFVNRCGLDTPGLTWDIKLGARRVSRSPAGSPRCSSCSCWAARIRSITCSAPPCVPAASCTRCSNGSCAST